MRKYAQKWRHILTKEVINMINREYYLKFINPNDVSLCKHCKIRKRKFKNIVNGYSATCGYKECIIKERENTYQAKTGYKNPSQNPDVKGNRL